MAYFRNNDRRNITRTSKEETIRREQRGKNDSRHSYLRAFKKYYIDKLIQQKCEKRELENKQERENFKLHEADKENRMQFKDSIINITEKDSRVLGRPEKTSTMTDSTSTSRAKSTFGKISQSKIVNMVHSNDCELQTVIYGSISEVEREVAGISDSDLTKENKLLRQVIGKLRVALTEKLQNALKRNKLEVTSMFQEYSAMIKKLLQDKQVLTDTLESAKKVYNQQERLLKQKHDTDEDQLRIVLEENRIQASNTRKQMEQFLEVIEQYEEEAETQRGELQNLRQKLVQLEMENDRLKNMSSSFESTNKLTTKFINDRCQKKLQKYAQKIEALLEMLQEAEAENQQLNKFLKSCKCSRIDTKQMSRQTHKSSSLQEVVGLYQRQLLQAEKEHIKGQMQLLDVLNKKDECIERLNLLIQSLRQSRYSSVDRITQDVLQRQLSIQNSQ